MFKANKYTKWYYNIITQATAVSFQRTSEYLERHHIIPKSLGGSNDENNLVNLTAREHYICHQLLVRMVEGVARRKMYYALWIINNKKARPNQLNSHRYARLRAEIAAQTSKLMTGRTVSAGTRAKQSVSKKITHNTIEVRAKLSKAAKQRADTTEWREKSSKIHSGKTISVEHRTNISNKLSGAGNGRALVWKITFENDQPPIHVTALKEWCRLHNINYLRVYHRAHKSHEDQNRERQFYNGVHATLLEI